MSNRLQAAIDRLQPKTYTAIDVTSANYTDSNGFLIYIPASFTGNIVATPFGGSSPITFSSYTTGDYLRGGAMFKAVTTDTEAKTGLEAWR